MSLAFDLPDRANRVEFGFTSDGILRVTGDPKKLRPDTMTNALKVRYKPQPGQPRQLPGKDRHTNPTPIRWLTPRQRKIRHEAVLNEILEERVRSSRSRVSPRGVKRKMSNYCLRPRKRLRTHRLDVTSRIRVVLK